MSHDYVEGSKIMAPGVRIRVGECRVFLGQLTAAP